MHIRSYESKKTHQHPIGFGSLIDGSDQKIYNSDADWVAPSAKLSPTTSCGTGRPTCKVNVNDSDHSYFGMWNESPQQNRNYVWENLLNGNQVLFMDPYLVYYPRQTRNLCLSPVHGICREVDARWNNVRDNAGFILRYAHRLNLANVSPQPSLSSTGYCLAQVPSTGAEYLIYAPVGGTFSVDLSAMPPSRMLAIEWFNPTTGAVIAQAPIKAGATSQSFTAPFDGDAVLYLVDAAGHAGQKIMRSTK
jgi:hypothetical protein